MKKQRIFTIVSVLGFIGAIAVSCTSEQKAAAPVFNSQFIEMPFVVINRGSQYADAVTKTYDCDSQLLIVSRYNTGLAVFPVGKMTASQIKDFKRFCPNL